MGGSRRRQQRQAAASAAAAAGGGGWRSARSLTSWMILPFLLRMALVLYILRRRTWGRRARRRARRAREQPSERCRHHLSPGSLAQRPRHQPSASRSYCAHRGCIPLAAHGLAGPVGIVAVLWLARTGSSCAATAGRLARTLCHCDKGAPRTSAGWAGEGRLRSVWGECLGPWIS